MVEKKIKLEQGVIVTGVNGDFGIYVEFKSKRVFLTQTELRNIVQARHGDKFAADFICNQFCIK